MSHESTTERHHDQVPHLRAGSPDRSGCRGSRARTLILELGKLTLSLVGSHGMWEQAQLEQRQRELRLTMLKVGIDAFDAVLDSLPESSRACVWLADAIQLAEQAKELIDG